MFGTYPNGSLYLRIFLAAEKKIVKRDWFPPKAHWNLKCWREKSVLFDVFWVKVSLFLLSQTSRSAFDYGVCTGNQIGLFGSEKERNALIFKVHVILYFLLTSGQERKTSGWWSPKEKWHKWFMLMKSGWLMLYIGWQITLCRFFLADSCFFFKILW